MGAHGFCTLASLDSESRGRGWCLPAKRGQFFRLACRRGKSSSASGQRTLCGSCAVSLASTFDKHWLPYPVFIENNTSSPPTDQRRSCHGIHATLLSVSSEQHPSWPSPTATARPPKATQPTRLSRPRTSNSTPRRTAHQATSRATRRPRRLPHMAATAVRPLAAAAQTLASGLRLVVSRAAWASRAG